ncbi:MULTISPECIES: flagellar export chaperone FliS [Treponema]|jgi:flagellar protein fliS|uniref:Flagellar secretion chaperone FliS n=4 Tax=Treponema denticola TaxID=158 RepID=Q73RG9_TREDE|nr:MULTISPECIES: flagellar export chaperone FliS [Treponema]AAS10617.1 flagellar protein FliS [Treponema denticola ATCC 35405]EGC78429.1 flagellar protein FliS [Treponema denticola F0402]EMB21521.1 flagellar protein FliS [Treponema denticola OTK]EMB25450.1 flagellar protein FliS [Treponema denticola SP37]EMB32238.1 flagellar protein FliS [Treponema denticola MYR-T]
MSYNSQAAAAYKETSVKTASPGSLILMLYTEGIKEINLAISKMRVPKIPAKDIEAINNHIIKAQEIITELMAALDMDIGGEIAANLLSIYSYFNQQLLTANLKKDYKPLLDVSSMMQELYDVWKQILESQPVPQRSEVSVGVNIAG